jgi:hypothetical protein
MAPPPLTASFEVKAQLEMAGDEVALYIPPPVLASLEINVQLEIAGAERA